MTIRDWPVRRWIAAALVAAGIGVPRAAGITPATTEATARAARR